MVTQPIERKTQGRAPFLVPFSVAATRVATTIRPPTLDAMHARPRGIFVNLGFILRGEHFEILRVIREFGERFFFNKIQTIRQSHFAQAVMMPVTFAIGGNIDQLRLVVVVKTIQKTLGKCLSAVQKSFKSDRLRGISVVIKNGNAFSRRQIAGVRTPCFDIFVHYIIPRIAADFAGSLRLAGRKNGVFDTVRCQNLQCFGVDCRFSEPNSFGHAPKTVFKILDSPINLGHFIVKIGERHNQMPVHLRHCRAVSTEFFSTFFIRFLDEFVGFGVSRFHPRKESCAQIKAHSAVIIEDIDDFIVGIQNTSD